MFKCRIKQLLLGIIVMLATGGNVALAEGSVVFGGVDVKNTSNYFYIGGITAFNGDLDKNGVLMRAIAAYGNYDYDTTAVATGNVDADQLGLQAGIGYQWFVNSARFSLYGGIDYQDHDLDQRDPSNSIQGNEAGAAVQAELETLGSPLRFAAIGSYSTTFNTYWARARLGYDVNSVNIGPELVFGGNDEYEENRFGAFANWKTGPFGFQASAGYARSEGDKARSDDTSIYGALGLSYKF